MYIWWWAWQTIYNHFRLVTYAFRWLIIDILWIFATFLIQHWKFWWDFFHWAIYIYKLNYSKYKSYYWRAHYAFYAVSRTYFIQDSLYIPIIAYWLYDWYENRYELISNYLFLKFYWYLNCIFIIFYILMLTLRVLYNFNKPFWLYKTQNMFSKVCKNFLILIFFLASLVLFLNWNITTLSIASMLLNKNLLYLLNSTEKNTLYFILKINELKLELNRLDDIWNFFYWETDPTTLITNWEINGPDINPKKHNNLNIKDINNIYDFLAINNRFLSYYKSFPNFKWVTFDWYEWYELTYIKEFYQKLLLELVKTNEQLFFLRKNWIYDLIYIKRVNSNRITHELTNDITNFYKLFNFLFINKTQVVQDLNIDNLPGNMFWTNTTETVTIQNSFNKKDILKHLITEQNVCKDFLTYLLQKRVQSQLSITEINTILEKKLIQKIPLLTSEEIYTNLELQLEYINEKLQDIENIKEKIKNKKLLENRIKYLETTYIENSEFCDHITKEFYCKYLANTKTNFVKNVMNFTEFKSNLTLKEYKK